MPMPMPMPMSNAVAGGVLSLCSPSPSASGSLDPPPQLQAPPLLSHLQSSAAASSRFGWLPTPQHSYPGPGASLENAGLEAAAGAGGLASYPSWPMSSTSASWFSSSGSAGLQTGDQMDHRNPLVPPPPPPLFGAMGQSQNQNVSGWLGGAADSAAAAAAAASSQMGKCFALLKSPHDAGVLDAHDEVLKMSSFASLLPPPALVPPLPPASTGGLPGSMASGPGVPTAPPPLPPPYSCRGCTAPILDRYLYRTTSNSNGNANAMSGGGGRGVPGAVPGPESPQQGGAMCQQQPHGHKSGYADDHWHGNCMRCRLCTQPLEAAPACYSRNGSLYCKEDYTRY